MRRRNRIFTYLIACFFIFIGFAIIFCKGYPPISQADELQQNPNCANGMMACANNMQIYGSQIFGNNNHIELFNGTANFTSNDAFYVNHPINYEINLIVQNITTNITPFPMNQLYFLIGEKGEDFSQIKQMPLSYFLEWAKLNNKKVIQLKITSENQFYGKDSITFSQPFDMVLVGIVGYPDDHMIMTEPPIDTKITVESQTVGTNAIQSHGTIISNKQILGLTWMAIALAPMVLGGDMILRVIFEGDTISLGIH